MRRPPRRCVCRHQQRASRLPYTPPCPCTQVFHNTYALCALALTRVSWNSILGMSAVSNMAGATAPANATRTVGLSSCDNAVPPLQTLAKNRTWWLMRPCTIRACATGPLCTTARHTPSSRGAVVCTCLLCLHCPYCVGVDRFSQNLGNVHAASNPDRAINDLKSAIAVYEAVRGSAHPSRARACEILAGALPPSGHAEICDTRAIVLMMAVMR